MCGFVWSVYIISASNCQTPCKKLTRIVKGPILRFFVEKKFMIIPLAKSRSPICLVLKSKPTKTALELRRLFSWSFGNTLILQTILSIWCVGFHLNSDSVAGSKLLVPLQIGLGRDTNQQHKFLYWNCNIKRSLELGHTSHRYRTLDSRDSSYKASPGNRTEPTYSVCVSVAWLLRPIRMDLCTLDKVIGSHMQWRLHFYPETPFTFEHDSIESCNVSALDTCGKR